MADVPVAQHSSRPLNPFAVADPRTLSTIVM
jgi:hypothetical protein